VANTDKFPAEVEAQVASKLAAFFPPKVATVAPAAAAPHELTESLAVCFLENQQVQNPPSDLSVLTQATGVWHHQIRTAGVASHFARSQQSGFVPDGVDVQQLVESPLAERIDRVLTWADQHVSGQATIRLLVSPAYLLHALLVMRGAESTAILVDQPAEYTQLKPETEYPLVQFLALLRKENPAGTLGGNVAPSGLSAQAVAPVRSQLAVPQPVAEEKVILTPGFRAAAKSLGYDLPALPAAVAGLEVMGGLFTMPWTELYEQLKPGQFVNVPLLAWISPDLFRFVQPADPASQFLYRRFDGTEIRPGNMDTDGGSIPKLLVGLPGFSRWGFAPAFFIHDWLYIAHKCGSAPDNQWSFEATALIMAEAMKTLIVADRPMLPGKLPKDYNPRFDLSPRTLYSMYEALSSSVARNVFNDFSTVTCYTDLDLGYSLDFKRKP